jgi:hypothetical protein
MAATCNVFCVFLCLVQVLTKFHSPSTNTFGLAGFESLAVFSMMHIVKTQSQKN